MRFDVCSNPSALKKNRLFLEIPAHSKLCVAHLDEAAMS